MSPELSVIMVPTTRCNLSCSHCFEMHSDQVMTADQLQVVMGRVAEYCGEEGIGSVTFYWQGGEVLTLSPEWFERMDEIASEAFATVPTRIAHRMQSNLIPYQSEWAGVVRRLFGGSIGSSLDYPSPYRGSPRLRGDAFNAMWLKSLRRARADGIEVGVISVLNEQTLELGAESYLRFYAEEAGLTSLQINYPFAVDRPSGGSPFLDPEATGRFLVDLFEIWADEGAEWRRKLRINPFAQLLEVFSFSARPSHCNCIWSGNCAENFFSVGPDGSVGLCDCWVTRLPEFGFGNLFTQPLREIAASPARQAFRHRIDHVLDSDCADCLFLAVCYGGCIIRTYGRFGTVNHKDPYCQAYRALFRKVLEHLRARTSGRQPWPRSLVQPSGTP